MVLPLLLGLFLAPASANAGLFSFLSPEASAQDPLTLENTQNSQGDGLALQAGNVSPASILGEKAAKKDPKTEVIDPDGEVSIVAENALLATVSPAGGEAEAIGGPESFDDISVYRVRKGDTLAQIAEMYGVTPDTIISFSGKQKGYIPKEGDDLFIPPFSGVVHTVAKGETLQGIAKKYNIPVSDITMANIDLGDDYVIVPGEELIIPGAGMVKPSSSGSGSNVASGGSGTNASGYFINPLPSGRKTQGLHDKYAVDIGAPTGTAIKAAAAGTVTFASNGWNGGYGNVVFIKHANGTETRYAHQSKIATSVGSKVSQGQVIGYVGSTGRSTGPHLHFEVRGAKNPGVNGFWKR